MPEKSNQLVSFWYYSSLLSWKAWTLPWSEYCRSWKHTLGKLAVAVNSGGHSIRGVTERSVNSTLQAEPFLTLHTLFLNDKAKRDKRGYARRVDMFLITRKFLNIPANIQIFLKKCTSGSPSIHSPSQSLNSQIWVNNTQRVATRGIRCSTQHKALLTSR